MSADTLSGAPIQIPTSVRWGGNGTLADQTGVTRCKYLFQIIDQNGEPIRARQNVVTSLCACTTAAGTTDAGLGPKVPTTAEIASSLSIEQAATVLVATTAVAAANDAVKIGSTDDTGSYHLAGVIGVHGLVQNVQTVVGGANLSSTTFETDEQGMWSMQIVTADAAERALVITLPSGKNLFFCTVRAA